MRSPYKPSDVVIIKSVNCTRSTYYEDFKSLWECVGYVIVARVKKFNKTTPELMVGREHCKCKVK